MIGCTKNGVDYAIINPLCKLWNTIEWESAAVEEFYAAMLITDS